jgi:hypothetical protein
MTAQTASALGAARAPAEYLAELIREKKRYITLLRWDLECLMDAPLWISWRNRYQDQAGTEEECQEQDVAACRRELGVALRDLAALTAQQAAATGEAATQRPENGETQ